MTLGRWSWAWLMVLAACGAGGSEDAGVSRDAGPVVRPDAGVRLDAGEAFAPIQLMVTTQEQNFITLTWDAGTSTPTEWVVTRNDEEIARLSGTVRSYDDFGAPAGGFTGFDASASTGLRHAIELSWQVGSDAGPYVAYRITANDGGVRSNEVLGRRTPPIVAGWRVTRADGGWLFGAEETLFVDDDAPTERVSASNFTVRTTSDWMVSSIVLDASVTITREPRSILYSVVAFNDAGIEAQTEAIGRRRAKIVIEWQRRKADASATWVTLPYVHGLKWLDAEAPFHSQLEYRAVMRTPDGTSFTSNEVEAFLHKPLSVVTSGGMATVLTEQRTGLFLSASFEEGVAELAQGPTGTLRLFRDGGTNFGPNTSPATHILGGQRACAWGDNGVFCSSGVGAPQYRALVAKPTAAWLCGMPWDGGGASCNDVPQSANATVVAGPDCAILDGGFLSCSAINLSQQLPQNMGTWVDAQLIWDRLCLRSSDGFVNCVPQSSVPVPLDLLPWDAQRFKKWESGLGNGCGITADDRVRCRGQIHVTPTIPPSPPIKQVRGNGVFLRADGQLESVFPPNLTMSMAQALQAPTPFEPLTSFDMSGETVCGVTPLGTARCFGALSPPPAQLTFTQLAVTQQRICGLQTDAGVECWPSNGWPTTIGPWRALWSDGRNRVCVVSQAGTPECLPAVPMPQGEFEQFVANQSTACGLTARGELRCQPAAPVALTVGRYRQVDASTSQVCVLSVDGEVTCWSPAYGVRTPFLWDDFTSIRATDHGISVCGVRDDETAICTQHAGNGHP